MGEYYLAVGDRDKAAHYFTAALEKYPFDSRSLAGLQKMGEAAKSR
jgi:hypothetical protein